MLRVIDIATSGRNPAADTIIEIASIDLVRGGGFANLQQTYVAQPRPIPPEASGVHHILDDDVKGAPQLREVIEKFNGADVYVAHRSRLAEAFLTPLIGKKTWICTWRCAMRQWPTMKSHQLHAIRYALHLTDCMGIERKRIAADKATSNCVVAGAIFEAMLKEGAKFSDLQLWSSEPALLPFLNIGTERDVPLSSVPREHLMGLLASTKTDADVRFTAAAEMDRRAKAA